HCNEMICQQATLSSDAEWPKVADAMIEALEFTLGEGELIACFEQAVLGMTAGESKTTAIPAAQAYGPHHAERVIDVERHHLPSDLQPEIGQRLEMTRPDGTTLSVMVTTVTE